VTNSDMTGARPDDAAIEATMLDLIAERGAGKTICPSEVARALGGPHPDGWGPLMQPVRRVAVRLARDGRIAILRKGKPVDPDDFRGIYRLTCSTGASGPGSQSGV
jgi:hypothetical protein